MQPSSGLERPGIEFELWIECHHRQSLQIDEAGLGLRQPAEVIALDRSQPREPAACE